jgi:hypothetical protein
MPLIKDRFAAQQSVRTTDRMRLVSSAARSLSLLAWLWLAACARPGGLGPDAAGPGAVPADTPIAAFARDAAPGTRAMVEVSPGRSVPVTFQRAYAAASGTECRLLRVEDVPGGRSALVCRDAERGWVSARPLLRGGAVAVR